MNDDKLCDKSKLHSFLPLSSPHTSSFADMDGDCINELIIMSEDTNSTRNNNSTSSSSNSNNKRYLEIWRGIISNNQIKYCLTTSSVYDIKSNLGVFSLADVDRNGSLDIVFPVLESPPKILIGFNKHEINYDWAEDYCASHIKSYDKAVPLLFDDFVDNKNTASMQTYQISDSPKESFYEDKLVTPLIRFADMNSDSYPDFIVTLHNKDNFTQRVKIFYNYELKYKNKGTGIRAYGMNNTYENNLINNAIYASFFDIDENGNLDVVIVYKENNNIYNTIGLFDTHIYDCYYLKCLILKEKKINFANNIGVSFRYVCANVDGTRRMDLAIQATQLNQISLNLPYAYIGVGRSNNYIENFHVINGNNAKVNFIISFKLNIWNLCFYIICDNIKFSIKITIRFSLRLSRIHN